MTEIVLPSHTNALGTIFGGVVMGWVDIAAAIAAQRYARSNVVTASIDYLNFINPIKTGWTVQVTAQVSFVGRTSMEVEVLVDAEKSQTGERKRATHAYLTFVAVDEKGRPKQVPPYEPKTAEEKTLYEEAKIRRERRLHWR
ncbi:MAG: acyl-CoA thioesterase [Bdellovibrionales bacterium]|nr:acyl-CoA thioesterase [Bdellovibrionales bacterium]